MIVWPKISISGIVLFSVGHFENKQRSLFGHMTHGIARHNPYSFIPVKYLMENNTSKYQCSLISFKKLYVSSATPSYNDINDNNIWWIEQQPNQKRIPFQK